MKKMNSEQIFRNFKRIIYRFPIAIILMIIMTVRQLYSFNEYYFQYETFNTSLVFGYWLSIIAQYIYEVYFDKRMEMRWLTQGGALVLTGLYYFYFSNTQHLIDNESWRLYSIPGIRSMILMFVVIVAAIWIPTLKRKLKFADSYLLYFKGTYTAAFFALILFLGVAAILTLFSLLFFSISFDTWFKAAIIIFNLFQPTLFLTFLPKYLGESTDEENEKYVEKQTIILSSFLRNLITFIFIPINIVYTGVIVFYILTNLTSGFFSTSPLDTLILSYTISGWVLLALADSITHVLAEWFKKIFPLSLIFVLVLQMIATVNQMKTIGITHGRYLILLFGIGSVISAIWYILKDQDLYLVPIVSLIAGIIALIPAIDAVGVSVNSQVNQIENTLEKHHVLVDEQIHTDQSSNISDSEQDRIMESIDYLNDINALNQLSWFPTNEYYNAEDYLGFSEHDYYPSLDIDEEDIDEEDEDTFEDEIRVSVDADDFHMALDDFDQLINVHLMTDDSKSDISEHEITVNDEKLTVFVELDDELAGVIYSEDDQLIGEFDYTFILEELKGVEDEDLSVEDLTFSAEDGDEETKILVTSLEVEENRKEIQFFLFY